MSNNSLTNTPSGARWDSVAAQREMFADHGLPGGSAALIRGDHYKDQLLDALMYRLTFEVRQQVSQEVPAAYNAYYAREVMIVDSATREGSDHHAVEEIHKLMSGKDWSPDTLDKIADLVRGTGRAVHDSNTEYDADNLCTICRAHISEPHAPNCPRLDAEEGVGVMDLITREQAEEWAGRALSDDEMDRLAEALQHSSVPDAIGTIVASWKDTA